jgi:GTP-binding protein
LKITAEFVTSAAGAADLPIDGLPEVAMVGRSNVGKSSIVNALVRRRLARTSAAPGKTRLANVYRVRRDSGDPLYLVDLPGYGYARGGEEAAQEFGELTRVYFGRRGHGERYGREPGLLSALLLVDARHPGLASDLEAWAWLSSVVAERAIVGTKIDKLPRGQRIRVMRELESMFDDSVLPVSAATGEGMDELWKLIDKLVNRRNSRNSSNPPARATAPRPPTLRLPSGSTLSGGEGRKK